jgi:hypothetical protein
MTIFISITSKPLEDFMQIVKYKEHYKRFRKSYSVLNHIVSAAYDYNQTNFKSELVKYQQLTFDNYISIFEQYMNNDVKIAVD